MVGLISGASWLYIEISILFKFVMNIILIIILLLFILINRCFVILQAILFNLKSWNIFKLFFVN